MKALKSKRQERLEIEQQTFMFLKSGGQVVSVERGASGQELGGQKLAAASFSSGARTERTPLTDEIKAIEERRQSLRQNKKIAKPKKSPRRVLLTDDFGEPLRWSWKDE